MRRIRLLGAALGVAAFLAVPSARAQEEVLPPDDVVMLPCDGQCIAATRPRKVSGALIAPPYTGAASLQGPSGTRITRDNFAEGFVELQFTVRADGSVSENVDVLRLVASQSYADLAKRAVRDWRFEPATANGKPVSFTQKLRAFYELGLPQAARGSIIAGYNESVELIKVGKMQDADGKLAEMYRLPDLNFYERGMLTYLRASIAMQRRDCVEADRLSGVALAFRERLLRTTQENLFRTNIAA